MIPFSLLWCGFAIFWETSVIHADAPIFMKIRGVPFVLVGLYMVFGRFIADAMLRDRTFYTVTTERALIRSGLFNSTTVSVDLRSTPEITVQAKGDGSGDLIFGSAASWSAATSLLMRQRGASKPPAFEMIADVQAVYNLVLRTKRELLAA
ncbi:MAG TPA: hypothetical protein VHL57_09200 [Flavobacteriales bacterium]|nr:hypothetical protein [Flavobacteriales bacterium]